MKTTTYYRKTKSITELKSPCVIEIRDIYLDKSGYETEHPNCDTKMGMFLVQDGLRMIDAHNILPMNLKMRKRINRVGILDEWSWNRALEEWKENEDFGDSDPFRRFIEEETGWCVFDYSLRVWEYDYENKTWDEFRVKFMSKEDLRQEAINELLGV
jgi:hypothetical protein